MLHRLSVGLVVTIWLMAPLMGGEIHGQIKITEALTKKRVTVNAYGFRGAAPTPAQDHSPASEFGRVVVFLEETGGSQVEPVRAVLNQQNQRFAPDILMVPVGSTVEFPNSDRFFHNVFSLSRAKSFDLGYYPAGKSRAVQFDTPGVVQVYCHLHPNMSAAIVVTPSERTVRPDEAGRFVLSGVPEGPRTLVAWHKSGRFSRQTIQVPSTGSISVSVNLPVREETGR